MIVGTLQIRGERVVLERAGAPVVIAARGTEEDLAALVRRTYGRGARLVGPGLTRAHVVRDGGRR